jgi:hypothetical protein
MTNFGLYQLLNFIVNKDVYSRAITPDQFDLELKSKNLRLMRKRLGLPETYIPGAANEGAGVTRLTDTDLLPFLVEQTVNPVSGIINLAANWYYILDWYTSTSITSDLMSYEEISNRRNNYITKPTTLHPAAYIVKAGLRVLPTTITGVTVVYYRKPLDPVFTTVTDPVTLRLAYSPPPASVELEWDDGSKLDILNMILQDMGLNIERGDVQQMAAKLIQTGK